MSASGAPLRVVRVIGLLEPGGAQLSAFRLTRALRRHGITSRLIAGEATPAGLGLAREHGLEVESFAASGGLQWEPSPAWAAWLAPRLAGAADLVHAHMFGAWWAAAQVIPDGVPLVASEHNTLTWPGRHHAREMRAALARVDLFFAHGPAATAYVRALGCPPQRLLAGTSALDGVGSRPLPGLPVPRIVSTGRLAPDKGPDVLVEAIALMRRPPPVFMLGEGRMRARLERRIAALGLDEVIHLPGWKRDPGRWVAGASALALPSREEAWSQSAVLAMALGTPVVGTSVEALPEVLDRGRGILVPPEDPEALAGALEDVLAGRRSTDRAAARAYAAQFTPVRVAARYAAHYRQLAEAARRPATIPLPARQPHRSDS